MGTGGVPGQGGAGGGGSGGMDTGGMGGTGGAPMIGCQDYGDTSSCPASFPHFWTCYGASPPIGNANCTIVAKNEKTGVVSVCCEEAK